MSKTRMSREERAEMEALAERLPVGTVVTHRTGPRLMDVHLYTKEANGQWSFQDADGHWQTPCPPVRALRDHPV